VGTYLAGVTSISYALTSGTAPVAGDLFELGSGSVNAEVRTLTSVTGSGPYTLNFLATSNPHANNEVDTTATRITYNAVAGGPPVASDTFTFGNGTVNAETATVSAVSGTGPYTLTVPALTHNPAMGEVDNTPQTSINYTLTSGQAPAVGDSFQFGTGVTFETRQLTGVTGSAPYTLTFSTPFANLHPQGEADKLMALQLTLPIGHTISQVALRHSAKLAATIAVYGAHSQLFTRTLLDSAPNASLANWTSEALVDGFDDSEAGFGGPQIAIDEATGNIHVFRAVTTTGGPTWHGVTYWLGTPASVPMSSGSITWNPRLIIDATANSTDPPDIAGAVDSTGRVYVFWTTAATGGAIKYVTLVSPYTAFSPAVTVPTVGANPRFPHVPAQAPLTGGVVPLVYQSGASNPFSINLNDFYVPPAGTINLGGILTSGPGTSSWGPSHTDVFVRGTDNGLWQRTWNGTTWSNWVSLGGILTADPTAVSWGPNRIDVFVRGTDNGMWQLTWNGSTWSNWQSLGGILTSAPEASSWGANHLDVFVRGTDKGLWQLTWNGSAWSNWQSLGGIATSSPTAVSSTSNRIDVFVRGTDNGMWQLTWNGSVWSNWQSLGGILLSGPEATSCAAGHLDVFVIGTDLGLWQLGFNGSSWGNWQSVGGVWASDPGAVCPPGTTSIVVFERGVDQGLWQMTRTGS
jgi:hypothetical protein